MLQPLCDFILLFFLGSMLVSWAFIALMFGLLWLSEAIDEAIKRAFRYLNEHPEVIGQAIRWAWQGLKRAVKAVLLTPHRLAARLTLYLFRDLVVMHWPLEGSTPNQEWQAFIAWWLVIPAMFAVFWLFLLRTMLGWWLPWPRVWLWLLAALSTAIALRSYRQQYRQNPVRHYRWPQFMAHQTLLGAELRMEWALFCLHLRLSRLDVSDNLRLKKQHRLQQLADWWQEGNDDDG